MRVHRRATFRDHLHPLTSNTDQHLISPQNISAQSNTDKGDEKKGNDRQVQKFLTIQQILMIGTVRNVSSTVWRICILILRIKGFILAATLP